MDQPTLKMRQPLGAQSSSNAKRSQRGGYAAAVRHSARVRFFKKAIPVGAAVAVILVLIIGIFDPFGRLRGLTLGPVSLSGTKITMAAPKLRGYRAGSRPYEMTAASASQDARKPNIVELNDITGKVTLENNGQAHIEATTGVYDSQTELLELAGRVNVRTDTGYSAHLTTASVDFKGGKVSSAEPVRVDIDGGSIKADKLDIDDNGKHIVFQGRVRAIMESDKARSTPPATNN
ncbi:MULTISPECIES: LPS export ABC transporter periplasmic protein LptC [unclassified Chelatococcus]|uniref:LPS export ABC transporter periplasmic protein LptC n=1 Tax=unclassified Chelatococcus TaxID=2638111 RepID=UPI001BCB6BB4|nr:MULTISPECIES: LPS export ABC transporter periplasmic protein LptC [unclassified Chelatococcus]MBS7696716.1 LPS export ABC transporter periplasmic protein LptC [Chelatococcus sp. YT9]MBX3555281.1 LPS export ABC transporter periplasmic protein LptC [Chelatococcus sp.]